MAGHQGGGSVHRGELPRVVTSVINLKGGTGKTTVAVAMAEGLCRIFRKRIAIIDCDFQCSASIALLGRKTLNELIIRNSTVDFCVLDRTKGLQGRPLSELAVEPRHCIQEAAGLLFMLAGSPDMPRRERQLLSAFLGDGNIDQAYEKASAAIAIQFRALLDDFDFVIIDCPPGLTLFSEAAVRASDGIIVPTLPNEISFAAIDHLSDEIGRIRPDRSFEDLLIGTVVSKLRHKNAADHFQYQTRAIERLLDRVAPGFQLLRPYLPYCRELESTSWRDDETQRSTFASRYGTAARLIEQLAMEFALKCRVLTGRQEQKLALKAG